MSLPRRIEQLEAEVGALLLQREQSRDLVDFQRYAEDPVGFIRDVLRGDPWGAQEQIAAAVRDNPLVVVRSCNAAGKDWLAARVALWWVYARRGFVLVTGPTERQVREVVMSQVHRAFRAAADLPGELYQMALRVPGTEEECGILAFTSTEASKLTGFHAPRVLVILTEAQGCEEFTFDGLQACATGDADRVLAVGNPLSPTGRFYTASRPGSGWHPIRISAFDHPNVVAGHTVILGGVTRAFIERMKAEPGEAHPLFSARVLGEFPEQQDYGLIPRSWVERAFTLHATGAFTSEAAAADLTLAVDPARFGSDSTAVVVAEGPVVTLIDTWERKDTMATTEAVLEHCRRFAISADDGMWAHGVAHDLGFRPGRLRSRNIVVDEVGLGAGVLDRLRELGYPAVGFNSGHAPREGERSRYHNARAEAYGHLAQLLEHGRLALPRNQRLLEELTAVRWKVTPAGKVALESKDDLRSRLGRSPDVADSLAMAVYPGVSLGAASAMLDF